MTSYVIITVVSLVVGIAIGVRVSMWFWGLTKRYGNVVGTRVIDDGPGFIAIAIRMPEDQRAIAEGIVEGMRKNIKGPQ